MGGTCADRQNVLLSWERWHHRIRELNSTVSQLLFIIIWSYLFEHTYTYGIKQNERIKNFNKNGPWECCLYRKCADPHAGGVSCLIHLSRRKGIALEFIRLIWIDTTYGDVERQFIWIETMNHHSKLQCIWIINMNHDSVSQFNINRGAHTDYVSVDTFFFLAIEEINHNSKPWFIGGSNRGN